MADRVEKFWSSHAIVLTVLSGCDVPTLNKLKDLYPDGRQVLDLFSDLRRPLEKQVKAAEWIMIRLNPNETIDDLHCRVRATSFTDLQQLVAHLSTLDDDWLEKVAFSKILKLWKWEDLVVRLSKLMDVLRPEVILDRYWMLCSGEQCPYLVPWEGEVKKRGLQSLTFRTSDEKKVDVDFPVVLCFDSIKRALCYGKFPSSGISVDVTEDVLLKVILYCKRDIGFLTRRSEMADGDPIREFSLEVEIKAFQDGFLDEPLERLMDLMLAADFLGTKSLFLCVGNKISCFINTLRKPKIGDVVRIKSFLVQENPLVRPGEPRDKNKKEYLNGLLERQLNDELFDEVSTEIETMVNALLQDPIIAQKLANPTNVKLLNNVRQRISLINRNWERKIIVPSKLPLDKSKLSRYTL